MPVRGNPMNAQGKGKNIKMGYVVSKSTKLMKKKTKKATSKTIPMMRRVKPILCSFARFFSWSGSLGFRIGGVLKFMGLFLGGLIIDHENGRENGMKSKKLNVGLSN